MRSRKTFGFHLYTPYNIYPEVMLYAVQRGEKVKGGESMTARTRRPAG